MPFEYSSDYSFACVDRSCYFSERELRLFPNPIRGGDYQVCGVSWLVWRGRQSRFLPTKAPIHLPWVFLEELGRQNKLRVTDALALSCDVVAPI